MAGRPTSAKRDGGEKKAGEGGPNEGHGDLADDGSLASGSEDIAALDDPGRGQGGRDALEEQRHRRVEAGEVRAQPRAQRQHRRQQRDGRERHRDQVEDEGEARQQEVVPGAEEGGRHADGRAEVVLVGRVEGQRGDDGAAVGVVVVRVRAADAEEGPARRVARARDAVGRALQEVDLVLRAAFRRAGQNHEELEQDGAREEDDGCDCEERSYVIRRWQNRKSRDHSLRDLLAAILVRRYVMM